MMWAHYMKTCGIYKIQSIIKPEKCYIGSTVWIEKRWMKHSSDLKLNRHHSKKLQYHYNKYGKDALCFNIIEECKKDMLIIREQYYIDTVKPWFNVSPLAYTCANRKLSEEHKRKISEANKGKRHTTESKIKMSISHKGKKLSDITKQKMSERNKGKIFFEATRLKLSKALKGRRPSFKGMHHSEETKQKISNALKGKVSQNKGVPLSDETKHKIGLANKGKIPWNKGITTINTWNKGKKRIYNIQKTKYHYGNADF